MKKEEKHEQLLSKQLRIRHANQKLLPVGQLIVQNVVSDLNVGGSLNHFELVEVLRARLDQETFPAIVSIAAQNMTTQNVFERNF